MISNSIGISINDAYFFKKFAAKACIVPKNILSMRLKQVCLRFIEMFSCAINFSNTRFFISTAALFVYVTATNVLAILSLSVCTCASYARKFAMRLLMAEVLPTPAGAMTEKF